ncbi:hypothetical protein C8Q73DRAFT_790632 [Cubamyces lactineus]|nr:hypothetical protein C8Q73DRAFT_790632 [Cubamyces lactineus]
MRITAQATCASPYDDATDEADSDPEEPDETSDLESLATNDSLADQPNSREGRQLVNALLTDPGPLINVVRADPELVNPLARYRVMFNDAREFGHIGGHLVNL